MNQSLLEKATKLKQEIDKSPEVIELERLNKVLSEDEEVMRLCYKKDVCSAKYEDSIRHFGEESEATNKARNELHQALLELNKNELVKQYNAQLKIVRKIYDKINEEIFIPFN